MGTVEMNEFLNGFAGGNETMAKKIRPNLTSAIYPIKNIEIRYHVLVKEIPVQTIIPRPKKKQIGPA